MNICVYFNISVLYNTAKPKINFLTADFQISFFMRNFYTRKAAREFLSSRAAVAIKLSIEFFKRDNHVRQKNHFFFGRTLFKQGFKRFAKFVFALISFYHAFNFLVGKVRRDRP